MRSDVSDCDTDPLGLYSGHAPTVVGGCPLVDEGGQHREEKGCTVPTGVHIRDVRDQLFDAAERVLVRDGPNALTSRAVTMEAGCAKGVLYRHFDDFDAFLAELVLDRRDRMEPRLPPCAQLPEPARSLATSLAR